MASSQSSDKTARTDQRAASKQGEGRPNPERVSAFAWIRPQDGLLVLTGPSTDFGYRIVHLDVEEGDMVETGQLLAELDVKRERAASLAVAKAQVHQAEVDADFADRELVRKEKLVQMRTPAISAEDSAPSTILPGCG